MVDEPRDTWLFVESIQDLERDPVGQTEKAKHLIDSLVRECPQAHVTVMWIDKGNWN